MASILKPQNVKIYIYILIFCSRFCKCRFTYGKLLLIQSKQVWNLGFFLLKGELFAEKFCELY